MVSGELAHLAREMDIAVSEENLRLADAALQAPDSWYDFRSSVRARDSREESSTPLHSIARE